MPYIIPQQVQQTEYEKAMRRFKLISQLTKRIKTKNITHKNQIYSWMDDNSFTENEKIELNWMTYLV